MFPPYTSAAISWQNQAEELNWYLYKDMDKKYVNMSESDIAVTKKMQWHEG